MILLDTCVVSELARPSPDPRVLRWFDALDDSSLHLSVLTLGEIRKGAELLDDGPRRDRVEAWLAELRASFADRILPVDDGVALCWGSISAATRRRGCVRPPIDGLIAATARFHGLVVATRNVTDFEGTGVGLVDPWLPRA